MSGAARIIAFLLLAQMVGGALVYFVLMAPLFGAPGFLVNAAAHPLQLGLSVLLGLVIGALSLVSRSRPFRFFVNTRRQ